MNIIFEINKQEYQIKGGTNDFILNRYYGTKEVKIKDTDDTKDVDDVKLVGYFGDVFHALEYVITDQALNNDATSLLELKDIYFNTLKDIKHTTKQFRI